MQLSTIILHVPDVEALDRCRDWYTRLGLQPSGDTPGESTWFETGRGTQLGIHTDTLVKEPASLTLYLEVSDVDATYERLRGDGFAFGEGPVDKPWGGRVVALKDPAGYDVQLVTFRGQS
jgi:catechol 2,3-dioxygenase-like lactoylglutathione lyase family enzyme